MKKYIVSLLFFIGVSVNVFAQGFREHTVMANETLSTIVQKYQVSPYELFQLNPDVEKELKVGDVLVLLKNNQYPFDATLIDLKKYKVKKKETLIDIATAHGVTEADMKKFNTSLYANPVKKGMQLKIPVFDKNITSNIIIQPKEILEVTTTKVVSEKINHVVQPKEGKYGISKKYGLTIAELEQQNPHIKEGLKIGQVLQITTKKTIEVTEETSENTENKYAYYTVQPKEGFYRLTKKLGVSKDSLLVLNPKLVNGIKLGMQLKYPVNKLIKQEVPSFNLLDSISNLNTQNITLMLPLRLNMIVETDSTSNLKNRVLRDRTTNTALDFYSGALMAIDSIKKLGISVNLRVFDTEYNGRNAKDSKRRIEDLLNKTYAENEVVIGPLVASNVNRIAKGLVEKNIPVLAPFPVRGEMPYANLYQTALSVEAQKENTLSFLEAYVKNKQVIIIVSKAEKAIKEELLLKFPNAKVVTPREGDLIIPKDFNGVLSAEKENVVIVEGKKVSLAATVTSILDTKIKTHQITLFTTSSKKIFEDKAIANRYKAKLNFHFPAVTKEQHFEKDNVFVKRYKDTYGSFPNIYVFRGYDLMMDVLLRQAVADNIEAATLSVGETSYTENKFNYYKSVLGGYVNKAMYILRYTPDFKIEEATNTIDTDQGEELKQ